MNRTITFALCTAAVVACAAPAVADDPSKRVFELKRKARNLMKDGARSSTTSSSKAGRRPSGSPRGASSS